MFTAYQSLVGNEPPLVNAAPVVKLMFPYFVLSAELTVGVVMLTLGGLTFPTENKTSLFAVSSVIWNCATICAIPLFVYRHRQVATVQCSPNVITGAMVVA